MKTLCRPLSVLLAATLALMTACAVPVTLPPPVAAPTSPPLVEQLKPLVPTAVPQPTAAPVVAPATLAPPTVVPPLPKPVEPQPLIAPDQMKFEGKVDIGGRSLYLTCYGKGEPTVVMDGWLLNNGGEFFGVMADLMKSTRACFYAKPNTFTGQSDGVKVLRTSKDLVADLRQLLAKAGLKPPYVLAGTGFGALNLTLFASQYPKDVVGLVFVDPQPPGSTQAYLDLVPKEAAADSIPAQKYRDSWDRFSRGIGVPVGESDTDLTTNALVDVLASEKEVLDVKSLGDLPIHVIRSQLSFQAPDPAVWRKMEQVANDRMAFFAKISSRYTASEGETNYVLGAEKALFVAPILKLVEAARAQKANEQAAAVLKIVDSYLGPLTDQDKFGGAVLIARDGRVLLNKGYGFADRDKKTAFTPESQFLIPLVQPWPAAAVMLLQAQSEGKFSLDDSVCKFINPCLERYKPITLRHLLANTAGLPDIRYDKDVDAAMPGFWFSTSSYDVVPDAKFGKPGERFSTGTIANGVTMKADFGNWAWLYAAGSEALNKDMAARYRERIKNPLGLGSYGVWGFENDANTVALYDGVKPAPFSGSVYLGSALMSAADLNTFIQALFDGRLLKPDQLADMLKPTVKVDTMPGDIYAALGAYVGADPAGNDLIAQTEVRPGFGAYWAYYPDSKLTVIVMNNLTDWANQPYRARDIGLLLARVILAPPIALPDPTAAPIAMPARQSPPEVNADKVPIPPEATSFDGLVDIGGHSLYLNCQGKGSPTIVFDAGLLTRGTSLFNWFDVKLPGGARVCAYDRPNVIGSYSDPVNGTTSSRKMVSDLRALLTKASLKPPCVLIGHSLGGMNMTLFSAQYQADVAGLVLMDPLPPGTFEEWMQLLKTESDSGKSTLFAGSLADLAHGSYENVDIEDSSAALNELQSLGSIPVALIAAQRPLGGGWTNVTDSAFEAKLTEAWKSRRTFYTRIAPKIEVIEVNESHMLNGDASNAAVTKALAKMVERARSGLVPAK